MHGHFVGYSLIGPCKLDPQRVIAVGAWLRQVALWAKAYATWMKRYDIVALSPKALREKGLQEEALFRMGHDIKIPEEVLDDLAFEASSLLMRLDPDEALNNFVESWTHGDDEAIQREIPGSENQVFTVGSFTWGDEPESGLYKKVDLFFKLGIISELGIE